MLTILYGTQTGTAERQAFRIARMALERGGVAGVRCLPADDTAVADWPRYCTEGAGGGHVVFILANANQGEAPDTYRRSWATLLSGAAPSMEGLSYAVFGLGDSLYAKFNYMAKMTHNRLRQLGGSPLLLRGLGDESDAKGLDDALLPWLAELWAAIGLPGTGGGAEAPPQEPLAAKMFPLFRVSVSSAGAAAASAAEASPLSDVAAVGATPRAEKTTFTCVVERNARVTAADHFQAVHHLDLRMGEAGGGAAPPVAYEVGDALGVYCPNRAENVDYILGFCRLSGDEVLLLSPNADDGIVEQTARPFFNTPMTARYFFTHYVDLEAVTEQDFFWMMSFFVEANAPPPEEKAEEGEDLVAEYVSRLRELANPMNPDDFLVYSFREKRNVCEVLQDYNAYPAVRVHPPLDHILSFIAFMRPRLFSISSAAAMDPPSTVSLTVAQLDWTTPMQRHRRGMCSSALVEAAVGAQFQCLLWEGTLTVPPVPAPLLVVATGTGVAPMRALIRHCAASPDAGWRRMPIYLVFGCRFAAKDFLYEEEWASLQASGKLAGLKVLPAFSRDNPAEKLYVQHRLGLEARSVGALLQGQAVEGEGGEAVVPAVVYVCGNAKNMPNDVQGVVQDIVDQVCCGGDEEQGRAFMKQMQREGRYQVDTWSA